jgi:NADH:ubiquinone oxidoreductase subunit C
MSNEELKQKITEAFPAVTFEDGEWLNVVVEPQDWPLLSKNLRENPEFLFDYLFCLTCVDWKTHLTMVYHFSSTKYRHTVVVKSKLLRSEPEIDSVSHLWRTAEFHEREVYDLFGVKFLNHPDLRRLLMTDEWVGFPLRKDYDDPVNMIRL